MAKKEVKKQKRTYICKPGYLKRAQEILKEKGHSYSLSHISNTALLYKSNPIILKAILKARTELGLPVDLEA